jgi:hypothetical protein
MDIYQAIRELYEEKLKLDQVIASLEQLQEAASALPFPEPEKRRGRKSMSAQERREVSARMRRYWASRRQDGTE